MGGGPAALTMVSSILDRVTGLTAPRQERPRDNSAALEKQRKAREEEERKEEAEERRKARERQLEARQMEKKRAAAKGRTTLTNGGAGLLDEPEVARTGLKTKLGE